MKFRLLLIILVTSCVSDFNKDNSKSTYSSSGFAYIYNEQDYLNKVTSKTGVAGSGKSTLVNKI